MSNSRVWTIDSAGIGHQLRQTDCHAEQWRTWCNRYLEAAATQLLYDPDGCVVDDPNVVPCRICAAELRIAGIAAEELAQARRLLSRSAA